MADSVPARRIRSEVKYLRNLIHSALEFLHFIHKYICTLRLLGGLLIITCHRISGQTFFKKLNSPRAVNFCVKLGSRMLTRGNIARDSAQGHVNLFSSTSRIQDLYDNEFFQPIGQPSNKWQQDLWEVRQTIEIFVRTA